MKKPFVNDEEVKFLLYQYKLGQKKNVLNKHQQNDVFINLYNIIEPLLKWTITGDITKIYSPKVRKQKYAKLIKLQESLLPNENGKSFKFRFDFTSALEKYLKDYIQLYGYIDDSQPWNYSFIYPFWELINKISLEKIEKSIEKYHNQYSYYLAVKFCDQYWNYIYKCIRRDLTIQVLSIDSIKHECSSNDTTNSFDKFQYKHNMYTLIDADSIDDILSSIKGILTEKEQQVLNLLADGYTHIEIAQILNITPEYSRKIKSRAAKKVRIHLCRMT
ncbi:LuxR C-terminal-related transcriptional regulator [Garciella nitratireducens]|jgi:DNA-binding CsgD family transcriptional regulator|uniref:LuxR C-terminal-related transcriptional regulator n=1 Tax=Garciella nitratireducens TaxID=218205 RepID=UPI001BD28C55|nr:LuxR C-terminal-related transcriptional regulator [Garciella nitratireducens]